jgi:hypothetical protein
MKNELQKRLELFAENWHTIKKQFKWHSPSAKRLAALLYAVDNKPINYAEIKDSHALMKRSVGTFSYFKENMSLCIATMLSLKENRKDLFARTLSVYEMLKKEKFRASDYLAVAAYHIAANAKPEEFQQMVTRSRAFYNGMKANSFIRTGQDDYIFSAMFGLSDIDVENGVNRIELLYQRFKSEFWSKSSTQKLAQILVLGGEPDVAVKRVLALRNAFKIREIRIDRTFTLPLLGVLALLPVDVDVVVRDIEDAWAFLKTQKGFGWFSVSKQELLIFAAGIVATVYAEDVKNDLITTSIATSIANIIIAQMVVVMASVVVAGAAATTAASGK